VSVEPSAVEPLIWRAARKYRQSGLFPLPIKPGQKSPLLDGWQEVRDFDLDLFMRPGVNVGLRMGPQPDGRNLYAIDIDPKHGGYEDWERLTKGVALPETAFHMTPSGGQHIFYEAPADLSVVNRKLAAGIDTRGPRGQVVAPPSQIPAGAYTFENPVHRFEVAPMPLVIIEALRADPIIERPAPSLDRRDGPDQWVREHLTWEPYLLKHGWGIESRRADGLYVIRPGKTDGGHSGVAHEGGALVLFTTEIPPELSRLTRTTKDGSGESVGLFAFIAGYEFGGDMSAAGRWISERYMQSMAGAAPRRAAMFAAPAEATLRLPQVPDSYWAATERHTQVRQAAWCRRVSPDALDVAMYVLQSCLVPPGFMIESPMGPQPLNMLACLVASTGDFKSNTLGTALDLLGPFPPWVDTIGMGSGEGIGAMFLKEEVVEDDKGRKSKTGKLVRNDLKAIFFEADEGSGLSEQAGRKGATVIANLCKAWSGSMLGEGNADVSSRRRVLRNDYRVGALVNIQPSNFGLLFSEANTGTGLTGRFLFSGTLDASMPDIRPEWPGQVEFPSWPQEPRLITMDPSILADADASIVERHRNGGLSSANPLSQIPASTARIAALNALAEGRFHVERSDYLLAQVRAEASSTSLEVLDRYFGQVSSDLGHRAAEAKAASATATKEAEDRIWLKKTTDRVMTILLAGPMSSGHLQARLSVNQRPYLDEALGALVTIGQIKLVGERYERT
jgi:hypothetical protein